MLGNTLLLTLAFVAHDYHVGFADTRSLSWSELVSWTLQRRQADTACPTAAALLGVSALADQLPRHAAMLYLPGVTDLHVKLLAWMALLGVTRFGAYLFTRCLRGVQALLDGWAPRAEPDAGGPRPGCVFVVTSLVTLVAVGLLAALGLRLDAAVLGQGAAQLARVANLCGRAPNQAHAMRAQAQGQLDAASHEAVDAAMRTVGMVDWTAPSPWPRPASTPTSTRTSASSATTPGWAPSSSPTWNSTCASISRRW